MSLVVWLGANTIAWPQGGGNIWAYLNWALGFRSLGCEVVWLEGLDSTTSASELRTLAPMLKAKLERYGLGDSIALYNGTGDPSPGDFLAGFKTIEEAEDADLLVNMSYVLPNELRPLFRRTALLDIDPGLTQIWMSEDAMSVPCHHLYFTIGEGVNRRFGTNGLTWLYTPPCVALDWWSAAPVNGDASFTTVSNWQNSDWVTYLDQSYRNTKRAGFLPFLDLPQQTSESLELALCLEADEGLRLPKYDQAERASLRARGWGVVHSYEVASTPWDYQSYIQRSKGEFSAAKPSCAKLQTGWVSDRTICYLASGKPAVIQDSGPTRVLPHGQGVFRFRTLEEAADCLDAVVADYPRQCALARQVAEEHFAPKKTCKLLLERALS
ncbi:MAG: hypothetical protein AABM43_09945 [Actinomycetota bacterium]